MTEIIMRKSNDSSIDYIKILLAIVVAVLALLVRLPSAFLIAVSDEEEEAYTDESGLPYFSDADSYYHIRLVDNMQKTGIIADALSPDGVPWDTHSFYPEGRSAVYQPGIVYLTIALWKIFNLSTHIDISRVEYYLPGIMAMITALVAFITGCRVHGKTCGLVAGILTSCAPEYVMRTSFGRFDTDFFVVIMNVLLILAIMEMLRTDVVKTQLSFSLLFVLTALVYANCWAPQFSTIFVGLTLIGGLVFVFINTLQNTGGKDFIASLFSNRTFLFLVFTGLLVLLVIGASCGFSVVGEVFKSLSFKTTQSISEDTLPNIYISVDELQRIPIVPDRFINWFKAYKLGAQQTVITGVGGVFAALAAICGLVVLYLYSFTKMIAVREELPGKKVCRMLFVVLGIWMLAGACLASLGVRFVEILTVPLGLLAGVFAGWLVGFLRFPDTKKRIAGAAVSFVIICTIVLPDIEGIASSVKLPTVTDASAEAMKWIKENADDPNAVIESWWDMGYYYESESGHPCLWDGGSQDPVRAILFSRAMTDSNFKISHNILYMLARSGNKAVDLLMNHTDAKTAFETLWEVLPMNSVDACDLISERCEICRADAEIIERLIHPGEEKEAYLVLTYTMVEQTGWYEYFSGWNFAGTKAEASESDDSESDPSVTGSKDLKDKENKYMMWRLFFDAEKNPYFDLKFECNDGVEAVRVWKVLPTEQVLRDK